MNEQEIILYLLQMLIDRLKNTKHFSFIQGHECAGGFSGNSQMMVAIFDAERMIRSNEI